MATTAGPSRRPSSELFPRATLRILTEKGAEKNSCDVVLAISHRIYWKPVKVSAEVGHLSLFDFKNESSLELTRLYATATWTDVENHVITDNTAGYSVTFKALFRGRTRWAVLSTMDLKQRDRWVHEICLRIAPWQLLHQRARELMSGASDEISADELTRRMDALLVGELAEHQVVDFTGTLRPSETVEGASYALPGTSSFHKRIQKLDWIDKLNIHFSNLAGIVAETAGKYAKEGGDVSNPVKGVEDFVKVIPGGASSVFHLVLLTARLVSMYAEASRGRKELPSFLVKVGELLQCVTESIVPVLQSVPTGGKGELLIEGNVFEVLVTVFDMMGKVEAQLLRTWQGQFFNSAVVAEVESRLDTLKMKVVSVVHTKHIRKVERDIEAVKKKVDSPSLSGILPVRPRKSAYFVGRGKELEQLRQVVGKYGSAAITGFGGLGKSQLMAAFADREEATRDFPIAVYWVVADGDASQVLDALAVFVETLKGTKMPEDERKKPEVVLSALKNVLGESSGRWLLCLDNVDNAGDTEVRGILDAVATMAEPTKSNGWVVVTSRCGHPTLWNRMEESQNVVLSPLSVEDGMYVLWRYKQSIRNDKANDEEIADALSKFKSEEKYEYRALRELCGFGWHRSLAGLPLALIHAGAYIRRYRCSFSEYLESFQESNEKSELEEILQEAEDLTLKREQRAILTTWSISMKRLSDEARLIIRAVAMLGNAPIPEGLVKEMLRGNEEPERNRSSSWLRRMYHKLVLGELVFDSSLLRRYENEAETTFELHRLVRMFILLEMKLNKEVQQHAFKKAVLATHSCLDSILKNEGKSFLSWPNIRSDPQFRYFPHSHALVNHFASSPSLSIAMHHNSALPDLYKFTGACLHWTGRLKEATVVQEDVVKLYRTIYGEYVNNSDICSSMHELGTTFYAQGRLGEAEKMYRKSLAMKYAIHGVDAKQSNIASTLHGLGVVFQAQGKLGEAEEMYRKSLDMKYSIYGRNATHGNIAVTIHQLGYVFQAQGKLREAEEMYRKSLDMEYSIHGRDAQHGNIAASLHRLGRVFQAQGKLDEAEEMVGESLDMMYSVYGKDSNHRHIRIVQSSVRRLQEERDGEE